MNILELLAKHLRIQREKADRFHKHINQPETRVVSMLLEHLSDAALDAAEERRQAPIDWEPTEAERIRWAAATELVKKATESMGAAPDADGGPFTHTCQYDADGGPCRICGMTSAEHLGAHLDNLEAKKAGAVATFKPPLFKGFDSNDLVGLVQSHLTALDDEERLEFFRQLEAGYCRDCGRNTGGQTCYCTNDE